MRSMYRYPLGEMILGLFLYGFLSYDWMRVVKFSLFWLPLWLSLFYLFWISNNGSRITKNASLLIFLRFYLFIHERHRERGRDMGRGRSRLHAGSPAWDSIPGLWDHALSRRQMLNCWDTQASQEILQTGFEFSRKASAVCECSSCTKNIASVRITSVGPSRLLPMVQEWQHFVNDSLSVGHNYFRKKGVPEKARLSSFSCLHGRTESHEAALIRSVYFLFF